MQTKEQSEEELDENCKGKQNPYRRHTLESEAFTSTGRIPLIVCKEYIVSAGRPWIHRSIVKITKTTNVHYLYSKQRATQHIDS